MLRCTVAVIRNPFYGHRALVSHSMTYPRTTGTNRNIIPNVMSGRDDTVRDENYPDPGGGFTPGWAHSASATSCQLLCFIPEFMIKKMEKALSSRVHVSGYFSPSFLIHNAVPVNTGGNE